MFYDLSIPWTTDFVELQRTLNLLAELEYNVVALNHVIRGKVPADISNPIPEKLPFVVPARLKILRRCTLVLSDTSQNHRLSSLSANYDIFALRPTEEKGLLLSCTNLECDLVSLDLTVRYPFHFKFKMLGAAMQRGVRIEICYAAGLISQDPIARRNLISNATSLIRATRSRGMILSSEAPRAVACRGPWDVINLAAVWGLSQERGREAIGKEARAVMLQAEMKRRSFRGVIDVVYGGEKPEPKNAANDQSNSGGQKRKAGAISTGPPAAGEEVTISKREMKRRAKAAREEAQAAETAKTATKTP